MVALPVGEITDRVKSQDDSFQHVPSGVILNALSVVTVLEHGCKLHQAAVASQMNEILICIPCM